MFDKKYVFACGCPRSGTTALWSLLASHSSIAIGVERYVKKAIFKTTLDKSLFTKERFFDYHVGDTHYPDLTSGAPGKYYQKLESYYDSCTHFGDKIPKLYPFIGDLISEFDDVKILFIYRNVFDVVQSYKKRFLNSEDRWNVKIDDGILDWNKSLEAAKEYLDNKKLVLVNYESLFYQSDKPDLLFEVLNLESNNETKRKFENLKIIALKNDERRESILTSLDKKRILKHANFSLYQELLNSSSNVLPELYKGLVDSNEGKGK